MDDAVILPARHLLQHCDLFYFFYSVCIGTIKTTKETQAGDASGTGTTKTSTTSSESTNKRTQAPTYTSWRSDTSVRCEGFIWIGKERTCERCKCNWINFKLAIKSAHVNVNVI